MFESLNFIGLHFRNPLSFWYFTILSCEPRVSGTGDLDSPNFHTSASLCLCGRSSHATMFAS